MAEIVINGNIIQQAFRDGQQTITIALDGPPVRSEDVHIGTDPSFLEKVFSFDDAKLLRTMPAETIIALYERAVRVSEDGTVSLTPHELCRQLRRAWLNGVAARSSLGVPGKDPRTVTWDSLSWDPLQDGKGKWEALARQVFQAPPITTDHGIRTITLNLQGCGESEFRVEDGQLHWRQSNLSETWYVCELPVWRFNPEQLQDILELMESPRLITHDEFMDV